MGKLQLSFTIEEPTEKQVRNHIPAVFKHKQKYKVYDNYDIVRKCVIAAYVDMWNLSKFNPWDDVESMIGYEGNDHDFDYYLEKQLVKYDCSYESLTYNDCYQTYVSKYHKEAYYRYTKFNAEFSDEAIDRINKTPGIELTNKPVLSQSQI